MPITKYVKSYTEFVSESVDSDDELDEETLSDDSEGCMERLKRGELDRDDMTEGDGSA